MASPTDLPRRLAASIGNSIDAAGDLPAFQRQLLDHMRSMDHGIQTLVEAIEPMRSDIAELKAGAARLERTTVAMQDSTGGLARSIGPDASGKLDELIAQMGRMEDHVANIDGHIPGPDAPGTIAKAKEALIGSASEGDDAT